MVANVSEPAGLREKNQEMWWSPTGTKAGKCNETCLTENIKKQKDRCSFTGKGRRIGYGSGQIQRNFLKDFFTERFLFAPWKSRAAAKKVVLQGQKRLPASQMESRKVGCRLQKLQFCSPRADGRWPNNKVLSGKAFWRRSQTERQSNDTKGLDVMRQTSVWNAGKTCTVLAASKKRHNVMLAGKKVLFPFCWRIPIKPFDVMSKRVFQCPWTCKWTGRFW